MWGVCVYVWWCMWGGFNGLCVRMMCVRVCVCTCVCVCVLVVFSVCCAASVREIRNAEGVLLLWDQQWWPHCQLAYALGVLLSQFGQTAFLSPSSCHGGTVVHVLLSVCCWHTISLSICHSDVVGVYSLTNVECRCWDIFCLVLLGCEYLLFLLLDVHLCNLVSL